MPRMSNQVSDTANKWGNRWNPITNLSLELAIVSPSSCETRPTPSPSPRAWRARPRAALHNSGWCRCRRTPPPRTSAADTSRECRHWLLNADYDADWHLRKLNAVTFVSPTVADYDADWLLIKLKDVAVVSRVGWLRWWVTPEKPYCRYLCFSCCCWHWCQQLLIVWWRYCYLSHWFPCCLFSLLELVCKRISSFLTSDKVWGCYCCSSCCKCFLGVCSNQ